MEIKINKTKLNNIINEKEDEKEIKYEKIKEENVNFEIIEKLEIKLKEIEKENKELKEKITYIDANLKINYIVPVLGFIYYLYAVYFNFQEKLKLSNAISTTFVLILLSVFFYKENLNYAKYISKKILFKKD